jgi:hypothetical protein
MTIAVLVVASAATLCAAWVAVVYGIGAVQRVRHQPITWPGSTSSDVAISLTAAALAVFLLIGICYVAS